MNISELIEDLQKVKDSKGDLKVVIKESSGICNERISVGWDGGHIISDDYEDAVATITSYVVIGLIGKGK